MHEHGTRPPINGHHSKKIPIGCDIVEKDCHQHRTREVNASQTIANILQHASSKKVSDILLFGVVLSVCLNVLLFVKWTSQSDSDATTFIEGIKEHSNATFDVFSGPKLPPVVRTITIRGERHSGTKLVRAVVNSNVIGLTGTNITEPDGLYGWKHGFLRPNLEQIHESDRLIIVTRDVFQWLASMYTEPYKIDEKHNMAYGTEYASFRTHRVGAKMFFKRAGISFSQFLRANWTDGCHEPFDYYKDCTYPFESSKNVVQLRTEKYKNWLSDDPQYFAFDSKPPHANRALIRHETILELGQEIAMSNAISGQFGLDMKRGDAFKSFGGYVKMLRPDGKDYQRRRPRIHPGKRAYKSRERGFTRPGARVLLEEDEMEEREMEERRRISSGKPYIPPSNAYILDKFSMDDVLFVLDNLDWEFETNVLNYTYDYALEYVSMKT